MSPFAVCHADFVQLHSSPDQSHLGDNSALLNHSELQNPFIALTQMSVTPHSQHVGSSFLDVSVSTKHFDLHPMMPPQTNHGNHVTEGIYVQGDLDVQTSFLTPKQMKKVKTAKKMHKNAAELNSEVNGGKPPIVLLPGAKVDLSNLGFLDIDPGSDAALQRGDHIGVEVLGMPDFL
eukprot:gnl/MRDRNA2_/MRDRNA2_80975_c0_seq1.p1 gnl/MRDRNA2_/MRDRNA2_80975_c0~~gnl/MRDRNA2_/MRDRNA2_80975_c0_seq1.p1  ORF type:complete len:177 (-),score=24.96 gnl/MRDRNA2_/MRDRNA2_80975_c0_seq1:132-662(-)